MSQIINNVVSEYDMPTSTTDKICNTCIKEDVCSIKGDCANACKRITQISEEVNIFIDTTIVCKKWSSKPSGNIR